MTTELPPIPRVYPALPSLLRKYDRLSRQSRFTGGTAEEFLQWQDRSRDLLRDLLGLDKMEPCPPEAETLGEEVLPEGIRRRLIRFQTEPEVWTAMFLLIPPGAGRETRVFLCPPGHNGAGKFSVAGVRGYPALDAAIERYHYDYGLQLARLGYVAACPDCRGFGERRERLEDASDPAAALKGDCFRLAHMGEPLGIPVAGMLTWDLMRTIDYLQSLGTWDARRVGCCGFSGGGMQTLWLAALDGRVDTAVISGYLYGYRDALLVQNHHCSCNYVPHLWEHLDMGDIASLIAPRPLLVQSCRDDSLNGPSGIDNVLGQMETVRAAYRLLGAPERVIHEICPGPHRWHGERLAEHLAALEGDRPD